jgi:hypothetical protein
METDLPPCGSFRCVASGTDPGRQAKRLSPHRTRPIPPKLLSLVSLMVANEGEGLAVVSSATSSSRGLHGSWWDFLSRCCRVALYPRHRPNNETKDGPEQQQQQRMRRDRASVEGMVTATTIPAPPNAKEEDGCVLSVAEVERRMRCDGFQKYVRPKHCGWGRTCPRQRWEERSAIAYHLYGRGFGWALPQRTRTRLILEFVDNENAVARMKKLLDCYEGSSSFRPCGVDGGNLHRAATQHVLWRKGQETVLRYETPAGGGGTTIFHVGSRLMPYLLLLQRESASSSSPPSPSCGYIAAATTVANYKVTESKLRRIQGDGDGADNDKAGSCGVELVDTNRYTRHWFEKDDDMLTNRVLHDEGGSSREVLRDLVGTDRNFESFFLPKSNPAMRATFSQFVADALLQHGPALVESVDMTTIRQLLLEHEELEDESEDADVIRLPMFDVRDGDGSLAYRELGKSRESEAIEKTLAGLEKANGGSVICRNLSNNIRRRSSSSSSSEADDRGSQSSSSRRGGGDFSRPRRWGPSPLHAMVLVGFRHDPAVDDKHWFLLQNSWKGLPLLEVSSAFLAKQLRGSLIFVMGNVVIPSTVSRFARRDGDDGDGCCLLHGECSYGDDGGDGFVIKEEEDEDEGAPFSSVPYAFLSSPERKRGHRSLRWF